MMLSTLTASFSAFASGVDLKQIPEPAVTKAKACFLDWILVTLLGAAEDDAKIFEDCLMEDARQDGPCTVIGRQIRTGATTAATINGFNGHLLDYDDMHVALNGHPGVVIFPGLYAAVEAAGGDGRDIIVGFVIGAEVACRLGLAMNPSHYARGWHATSTIGVLGAVAAAGHVLHLDARQMSHALSIGATQAAGLRRVFGGMAKPFNAGRASAAGLLAARLAQRGFTGAREILDGHQGFCDIFSLKSDWRAATDGLGARFIMADTIIKVYPACYSAHPVIDAAVVLNKNYKLKPQDIAGVIVSVSPMTYEVARFRNPQTTFEAKFSATYCAAVGLIRGNDAVNGFTEQAIKSSAVRQVMKKIQIEVNDRVRHNQRIAEVSVQCSDGSSVSHRSDMTKPQMIEHDPWSPVVAKLVNARFDNQPSNWKSEIVNFGKRLETQLNIRDVIRSMLQV